MRKTECLSHIRKAIAKCAAFDYFGECVNKEDALGKEEVRLANPVFYEPAGLVLKDILDYMQMHEEILLYDDYVEALKQWYQMDTNIRDYLSAEAVDFMESQAAD